MSKPIMDLRRLMEMTDHEVIYVKHLNKSDRDFGKVWWEVMDRLDMRYNQGFFTQPVPKSNVGENSGAKNG